MEVIVSGSGTGSSDSFLSVSDLHTGSHLLTFKQSSSSKHAATCLGSGLAVAQNDKAVVNVYRWHRESIDQKLIVPEKLDTLCSSHNGTWLAGGSASGKIYVWEVASGNLLFVKEAHLRDVTVMTFSADDLFLVTGSNDTSVKVWSIVDALSPISIQEVIRPRLKFSDHTREITGLFVSTGPSVNARLFTASADQSVRIRDLAKGELISVIVLPSAITCMTVDLAERAFYAGTADGWIHETYLYKRGKVITSVGGLGSIVSATQETNHRTFGGLETSVSAISLSADGSLLTYGADDGSVYTCSLSHRSPTRKLKQMPSAVTTLLTVVRPDLEPNAPRQQRIELQDLKRVQTERDRDEHNIYIRLSGNSNTRTSPYTPMDDLEAINVGRSQIVNPTVDHAAQETIAKLQQEIRSLNDKCTGLSNEREQMRRDLIASRIAATGLPV